MKTRPFLVHALTPIHAGTGRSEDLIDLPIARERATGIPFVPGSGLKGVLRDAHRSRVGESASELRAVFGPSQKEIDRETHAGALVVGDARLLALPVRSYRGVFAWVSCPLLLRLAARDLAGWPALPDPPEDDTALVTRADAAIAFASKGVELEMMSLACQPSPAALEWALHLAPFVLGADGRLDDFVGRFCVVDDETMAFLWENATQVDTRVSIDEVSGTASDSALWTEESLPPETLLVGLFAADRSRLKGTLMSPETVLEFALSGVDALQLGGKATTGRGRCRIVSLDGAAAETAS